MAEAEQQKVAWNINSQQAFHIFKLIEKATNYYLQGKLDSWYWTLSALRESVNHELKKEKEDELDELEKECNKHFASWRKRKEESEIRPTVAKAGRHSAEFSSNIRKYQRVVMKTLKELGFFPSKENRSKLGF